MLNLIEKPLRWLPLLLVYWGLAIWPVGQVGAADGDVAPALRYQWKAGQTYAYAVTVEVDQGDYLDILSGTPTYTVKKADQDGIQLDFRGALREKQQAKPGKRILFRPGRISPFSPFTGIGGGGRGSELTVNDRGEITSAKGSSQLPYLLGNLSQLMLVPLPAKDGEKTWKVTQEIAITLSDGRPRPILRDEDRKMLKAVQETGYTIDQVTKETVTIGKRFELKTSETKDGKPRFEIQGKGTLAFDLKTGLPSKLDYEQKLTVREGNATEDTPLKITFKLLDETERAKLASTGEGAPLFPKEPLTEALQAKALDELKSGDKGRTLKAMNLLSTKDPAKPNEDIAAALATFLADKDQTIRFVASKALEKWATAETAPALIKALDDDSIVVRHNAMDALSHMKSATAAEAVAPKLASTQDRFQASKALLSMGSTAEPAVLKLAEDKEWQTRSEVCKILKVIGTQKSVAALTALQGDPQALVKRQAQQALEAISAKK